jgi:ribosomal protein S18 acetylase RimI-like enzyme
MTEGIVTTLSLAFHDDPLMCWLFEDGARRAESLPRWWRWLVENRHANAEILTAEDDVSVALWHAPDPASPGADGAAPGANGFVDMLGDLIGTRAARRKLEALAVVPAAHPKTRHWYLAAVGTRPAFQGRGIGVRVVTPILERCVRSGLPAYLESTNPRNISFYERLGFERVGAIEVPGGPTLTGMWRTAQVSSGSSSDASAASSSDQSRTSP